MRRTLVKSENQTTFGSETALNRQIEVLTTLTEALLGELELLHSTVAATQINFSSEPELSLVDVRQAEFRIDFYEEVGRYEIALIKRALKLSSGNQRKAAQLLVMNSTTLNAKIKHYGIHTVDVTAQYSSHLDGFHRTRGSRRALQARPGSSDS